MAARIAILQEAVGLITTANPPKDHVTASIEDVKLGGYLYLAISASWGIVVQKSLCRHPAQIKMVMFTCYSFTLFIPTRMHLWRRCWPLSVLKPRRPILNRIRSSRTGAGGAKGLARSTQSRLLSPGRIATCNCCTVWRPIFTIYLTKIQTKYSTNVHTCISILKRSRHRCF